MSPARHLEELARLQRRVNRLFEHALAGSRPGGLEAEPPGGWRPEVDVLETPESYQLFAELPGVEREDVRLDVSGRRMELSGCRRAPKLDGRYDRMERSHGPFRRVFELGGAVDAERVEARLSDGVLRITLPKAGDRDG